MDTPAKTPMFILTLLCLFLQVWGNSTPKQKKPQQQQLQQQIKQNYDNLACKPCDQSSSSSEEHCCPDFHYEAINLQAEVGFYHFDFPAGNSDSLAFRSFYFNYPFSTRLQITDCFCAGDSFRLGISGPTGSFFRFTSPLPIPPECSVYSEVPFDCLFDARFFKDSIVLSPGQYNITIEPVGTPYLAGTGYAILQKHPDFADPNLPVSCQVLANNEYPCVWSIFD